MRKAESLLKTLMPAVSIKGPLKQNADKRAALMTHKHFNLFTMIHCPGRQFINAP